MKALPASLTGALTATAAVTGEYRALTVQASAPVDLGTVMVPDDRFAPHLRAGELAIVDPEDVEPMAGEIYVVMIASPTAPDGRRLRFVQLWRQRCRLDRERPDGGFEPDPEDTIAWWMRFGFYRRPVIRAFHTMDAAEASPSSIALSDGPMREEGIRRKIVGRVVGVVA